MSEVEKKKTEDEILQMHHVECVFTNRHGIGVKNDQSHMKAKRLKKIFFDLCRTMHTVLSPTGTPRKERRALA